MKIQYEVPDLLEEAGDLYLLELPEISERYERAELSLTERRYDLVYDTSEEIIHTFRIILPKDWEIETTPDPIKLKRNQVEYSAGYMIKGDTLIFRDDWRREGRIIPVEDYSEYKMASNEVLKYVKKPIILRRTGGEK